MMNNEGGDELACRLKALSLSDMSVHAIVVHGHSEDRRMCGVAEVRSSLLSGLCARTSNRIFGVHPEACRNKQGAETQIFIYTLGGTKIGYVSSSGTFFFLAADSLRQALGYALATSVAVPIPTAHTFNRAVLEIGDHASLMALGRHESEQAFMHQCSASLAPLVRRVLTFQDDESFISTELIPFLCSWLRRAHGSCQYGPTPIFP